MVAVAPGGAFAVGGESLLAVYQAAMLWLGAFILSG